MIETIEIDIPRRGFGNDLQAALASHGLEAEVSETEDRCVLHVRFADQEHDRLVEQAVHAIEAYLSDRMLPLVVQRSDGSVVVRPPAD
jgi:hypothetical protein